MGRVSSLNWRSFFYLSQYERGFAPKSVSNWEYQRFFPPRPRLLLRNSKPLVDKTGHLLPTARRWVDAVQPPLPKPSIIHSLHLFTSPATATIFNPLSRDGNFLGQYRGTYHLPRHITREFATNYNRCLSGQYKYRDYPRDLCCCEFERNKGNCDWRLTLGRKGDPVWDKPVCQTKCEGLQMLLDINNQHKHCRHAKCLPRVSISLRCTASSLHTALQPTAPYVLPYPPRPSL